MPPFEVFCYALLWGVTKIRKYPYIPMIKSPKSKKNLTPGRSSLTLSHEAKDFKIDTELHGNLYSWHEIHHWLQSGTSYVLLDSLENALETPRRRDTFKESRYFKIDTEHTEFLTWNTPLTIVRHKHVLLDSLGTLWRHLGYFWQS